MKRFDDQGRRKALALVGPTASGKTGAAMKLASRLSTEIIGVDSRQIYRHLDIGTAKPTKDEQKLIVHHMVDVADPDEIFNVGEYKRRVESLVKDLEKCGKVPFFVGGTGLYLKAVLQGLCPGPDANDNLRRWLSKAASYPSGGLHTLLQHVDPSSAERLHPNDNHRLTRALEVYYLTGETLSSRQEHHQFPERPFNALVACISRDGEELKERIGRRLEEMIDGGFIDEVDRLMKEGYDPSLPSLRAVGYPQIIGYLNGDRSLDEAKEEIRRATWQYARRQMTWFRGLSGVVWIHAGRETSDDDLASEVLELFENTESCRTADPTGKMS